APAHRFVPLTLRFLRLDLAARFQGNVAGAAWTVLAPLLQLAVFFLVFVHIFGQRVPGLSGTGVVAFLALGFWPWFAFSEAIARATTALPDHAGLDRKSTRLNSSHVKISYAVSCLKKKT